jgi:ribose transport system substrate-binding protein
MHQSFGGFIVNKVIQLIVIFMASLGFMAMSYAAGLDEIPADIRADLYDPKLTDPAQPIEASLYRDWKTKNPPPWTIGYASTYAGNTWRKAAMERLLGEVLPKWQKLGLVKDIIVTQSNLKDSLQIQQMRQLVDQGVDAIIVCCSNPTALNQTVKYAFDKGVPTFSFTGYLTSPYAVNSSVNYHKAGYEIGRWMAEEIDEKGNILVIEGIPGASASDSQNRGVLDGLSQSPDIKVVGNIAHMWTSQVGQAETQKWLATHPRQLDGIAVQSSGETGVVQALLQSGRDVPPISIGGELGALCYWRNNPEYISAAIQAWPPGDDLEVGFNIMMRTMQGQGPKIQSILVPTVKIAYKDVKVLLDENCDRNSTDWFHVGIEQWGGKEYLDKFFLRPADPEKYKP